jgi:threonine dehydrogenase-like Zn-dependent dehydrogenase
MKDIDYFSRHAHGKIAYMTDPGHIDVREYALPSALEHGSVMLEVIQTNVCGTDIHIFEGRHPLLKCGGLGHEMVGRVVALGEGVKTDSAGTPIRVGDRVVPVYTIVCNKCENCTRGVLNHCDRAFQYFGRSDLWPHFHGATFSTHYYIHPEQAFYRVPDGVSNASAASANCALSQVMYGLERADVGLGQTVVIQGAGGLGVLAVVVAKERGARVVVMDKVSSRLELARRFGADEVIHVDELSELNARVERVQWVFRSQGADVVVEVTGVPSVFSEGLAYLKPGGTYLVMGTISPGLTTQFDPGMLVRKSAAILGINRYPPRSLWQAMAFLERTEAKYPFADLLDRAFGLDETQTAIEMSSRREVQRATIIPSKETM